METLKYIILLFFLIVSAQSPALNIVQFDKPVEESLYDSRSCNDLYMQALTLEKESFSYAESSNKTQVASVVSTIFAPAIYYLGYSAYQDYKKEIDSESIFVEMEKIRLRMAEKRCFVK